MIWVNLSNISRSNPITVCEGDQRRSLFPRSVGPKYKYNTCSVWSQRRLEILKKPLLLTRIDGLFVE